MAAPSSATRGFTLVEVLVALAVMAIMSLMTWRGVDGIVRSREINQAHLEQTLRLQTVMAQWEQDLASIRNTKLLATPALSCDGKSVRITRTTDSGVQVVVWSLQPGDDGLTWQRWAGPSVTTAAALQQSWAATQQFQGDEPGQVRALRGVSEWQVYFYRNSTGSVAGSGGWSNCQSSGNDIGGVRVILSFAADQGLAGRLVRDSVVQL